MDLKPLDLKRVEVTYCDRDSIFIRERKDAMTDGTDRKKLSIKMTWGWALPTLLALFTEGNDKGKQTAKFEFTRMASAADQATEYLKTLNTRTFAPEEYALMLDILKNRILDIRRTIKPEDTAKHVYITELERLRDRIVTVAK